MGKKQVRIGGKVDLDICGAGFILGITREDEVQVVREEASLTELADPKIFCIECGWTKNSFSSWDHHQEGGPLESATKQVFWEETFARLVAIAAELGYSQSCISGMHCFTECAHDCAHILKERMPFDSLTQLVDYIDQLDTKGATSMPNYGRKDLFPSLSDVFAGMLLTVRDPLEQFFRGIELLKTVVESGQDPYGRIEGFGVYAEAKAKNDRQIAEAVKAARWDTTRSGLRLGYLETAFFGAPGALYDQGAQVVVALNPNLNGVRKFTIAGNGIEVLTCIEVLNAKESEKKPKESEKKSEWGGHPTIIGSPREGGSCLSLEEVVKVVKECL